MSYYLMSIYFNIFLMVLTYCIIFDKINEVDLEEVFLFIASVFSGPMVIALIILHFLEDDVKETIIYQRNKR